MAVAPWLTFPEATLLTARALKRVIPQLAGADEYQVASQTLRPTLVKRTGYTFITAVAPRYNRATCDLSTTGVFVFATPQSVVAVYHRFPVRPEDDAALQALGPSATPPAKLGALMEQLLRCYQRTLAAIAAQATHAERGEGTSARERMLVGRNVGEFHALLQATLKPLSKLGADPALISTDRAASLRLMRDAITTRWHDLRREVGRRHGRPASATLPEPLQRSLNRYLAVGGVVVAFVLAATTFGFGSRHRPLLEQPFLFWFIGTTLVFAVLGVLEFLRRKQLL
ncbi:MAG: hypothetical protein HYZ09_04115 [Candidatus Kerfeldbacteria bacterium]|nr:hypothetical protein [Candidatus Kerfeldbacteria bacterium]